MIGIGSFNNFQSVSRLNRQDVSKAPAQSESQGSEALLHRLRKAIILETEAMSVSTLLAPGMKATFSERVSSLSLNGDKSNTYDIFRYVADKCQNQLGCTREQAALLTLQVMQEAINAEGGRLTVNLAFKAYRQQLDFGIPPASA